MSFGQLHRWSLRGWVRIFHDTLDFIQVPDFPSAIETRSLPTLTRSYPRAVKSGVLCPRAKSKDLSRIIILGALVAGARSSGTVR